MGRMMFTGRCHCGNVRFVFETAKAPEQLGVRACDCSFCTRHGGRTTTDPRGSVRFTIQDGGKLNRYRFGLRTADFLVCGVCGVYLGAVFAEGHMAYATVNVNSFDEGEAFPKEAALSVNYDHETEEERRARRRVRWTPVVDFAEGSDGSEGAR
jgi:hypothetical protein